MRSLLWQGLDLLKDYKLCTMTQIGKRVLL